MCILVADRKSRVRDYHPLAGCYPCVVRFLQPHTVERWLETNTSISYYSFGPYIPRWLLCCSWKSQCYILETTDRPSSFAEISNFTSITSDQHRLPSEMHIPVSPDLPCPKSDLPSPADLFEPCRPSPLADAPDSPATTSATHTY